MLRYRFYYFGSYFFREFFRYFNSYFTIHGRYVSIKSLKLVQPFLSCEWWNQPSYVLYISLLYYGNALCLWSKSSKLLSTNLFKTQMISVKINNNCENIEWILYILIVILLLRVETNPTIQRLIINRFSCPWVINGVTNTTLC